MRFQGPTLQLLDTIYQSARTSILKQTPRASLVDNYLRIMLEPLSTEARVWIDSNFHLFDDSACYEMFRQIAPENDLSHHLRALYYGKSSQAIAQLLIPHPDDNPPDAVVVAKRLHVVVQRPHALDDFLNLYIAIAGGRPASNAAGLKAAVESVMGFWNHFNPYYYVAEIV